MSFEPENVLHSRSAPGASWSTINLSEAMPGVLTPLGWSVWGRAGEASARAPFVAMGALARPEGGIPADPEERAINIFYGRVAARVDFFCAMGDRLPGVTGEGISRDVFGFVPPGFLSRPSRRRWPISLVKFPAAFLGVPPAIRRGRKATETWWRVELPRTASLDLPAARAQLAAAARRFASALAEQATAVACGIQPVYEQLSLLAAKAGVDGAALMTGHGSHEETVVIGDLWAISRGRLTLEAFLDRHGYHGPNEGEISGRVWREDAAPVERLVERYRSLGDDADPAGTLADRAAERRRAEAQLLDAVSGARRAQARLLLGLADRYLPLRGVGKVSFLQTLDVARAVARRTGTLLAADGLLDDPEDVFYLTLGELTGDLPPDARDRVEERRELRRRYTGLEIPSCWTGPPEAHPVAAAEAVDSLTGVAASPGVAEGKARVVTDPSDADMEPGDVLVAHTTDPSW
ncbi:MAG TPA: PEP-utilizing protein mobile subunit, partial [Acidimicrobiia bacterium]|nr:PEP-utilizing protein mobile subunit [Acidimicrobiia bacterium]